MTDLEALAMLQNDPYSFLRDNSVTPYAAVHGGVCDFHMVDSNVAIQRPGHLIKGNLHVGQRFKIRADNIEGGVLFQAVHVPVQQSNTAQNLMNIAFTRLDGADIMITTQLTGCSVIIVPVGATYSAAHLQPNGETGVQLKQRLTAFPNAKVFGAPDYPGGRGVVIGVRQGGAWSFYAQRQDAAFNVLDLKKL